MGSGEVLVMALAVLQWRCSVEDCARFPPKEVCRAQYVLARSCVTHFEKMESVAGQMWSARWVSEALADARRRADIWFLMWCLAEPFTDDETQGRRERARALRAALGDEAYYSGAWPAPVPLWAIPEGNWP
jgi:hypothetical protein